MAEIELDQDQSSAEDVLEMVGKKKSKGLLSKLPMLSKGEKKDKEHKEHKDKDKEHKEKKDKEHKDKDKDKLEKDAKNELKEIKEIKDKDAKSRPVSEKNAKLLAKVSKKGIRSPTKEKGVMRVGGAEEDDDILDSDEEDVLVDPIPALTVLSASSGSIPAPVDGATHQQAGLPVTSGLYPHPPLSQQGGLLSVSSPHIQITHVAKDTDLLKKTAHRRLDDLLHEDPQDVVAVGLVASGDSNPTLAPKRDRPARPQSQKSIFPPPPAATKHKTLPRHRGLTVNVTAEWNGKKKILDIGLVSRDAFEVDVAAAFAIDLDFVEQMALLFTLEIFRDGHWVRLTDDLFKHVYGAAGECRTRVVICDNTLFN